MTVITDELKAKAEVYYGDEICREKTKFLLKEVGLPNGLLPLKDILEVGYVAETGFVWLKQKRRIEYTFEKIGKEVSYDTEITANVEKFKITNVKGVKTRAHRLWFGVSEIAVNGPQAGQLICRVPSGLFRSFPTSAFQI